MSRFPHTLGIKLKYFSPENFDLLAKQPFCFFLDSSRTGDQKGRYSFFGVNPVKTFSSSGGFITVDGRTYIDDPLKALARFESITSNLPIDPYLPFHGGLVGFVGHNWPLNHSESEDYWNIPDAWFGLYDTVITFDHLENCCWISSFGFNINGECDQNLAIQRCEEIASLINWNSDSCPDSYHIKPLMPEPVSIFNEQEFVNAVSAAKSHLGKKDWQRVNIAQRFHAPVAVSAWSIHKYLRRANPTPFTSFLRCGTFELSSTSPSCFLQVSNEQLTCNAIQKSIPKATDPTDDYINKSELLHSSTDSDPIILGETNSLKQIFAKKPNLKPAHLESDSRSHYLVNQIDGTKPKDCAVSTCLAAAMPGASMTGVPKKPVNIWLRQTEPSKRNIYTGAIGFIGSGGNSQFNMAVRTMMVKDNIAFVHAGQHIQESTNPEEAFYNNKTNVSRLFESVNNIKESSEI